MPPKVSDPGIGRKDADPGTLEWAQRWRLDFQSAVDGAKFDIHHVTKMLEIGNDHRAWVKLNRKDGTTFKRFDEFVSYEKPWGLSLDYEKFRSMLEASIGKQAAQLLAVPEPSHKSDSTPHDAEMATDTDTRLRAINRAPDIVQELYRDGLINQVDAARLGKKNVDKETVAAEVARVVESTKNEPKKDRRKAINAIAREVSGVQATSPEEKALKAFRKCENRIEVLHHIVGDLKPHEIEALKDLLSEE